MQTIPSLLYEKCTAIVLSRYMLLYPVRLIKDAYLIQCSNTTQAAFR